MDAAMDAPQVAEERDELGEAREARCVPVAKEILALIAEQPELFVDTTDEEKTMDYYSDLASQTIQKFLQHGTHVGDVKYIFQLCLQAIEGFTQPFDNQEQHNENQRAAHNVFKVLKGSEGTLKLGNIDEATKTAEFEEMYQAAKEEFVVTGCNPYTLQLAQTAINLLSARVIDTLDMYQHVADRYKWGLEGDDVLTVNDYDDVIKEMASKNVGIFGKKNAEEKSTGESTQSDTE